MTDLQASLAAIVANRCEVLQATKRSVKLGLLCSTYNEQRSLDYVLSLYREVKNTSTALMEFDLCVIQNQQPA